MTISYIRSASFTGPLPSSTTPPASPEGLASSPSMPPAGIVHDLSPEAEAIIIPNDNMEAGLSLRRASMVPDGSRLTSQQRRLSDIESTSADVDRLLSRPESLSSHSQRRSQLIFEQKLLERRTMHDFGNYPGPVVGGLTSRTRRRRPETAPSQSSHSPKTPDSAPAFYDPNAKTIISPGGLRELTMGSSATPASNRASWIRRVREHEALSDSSHTSHGGLQRSSSATTTSRRHSSFLSDTRSNQPTIPIFSTNSFDIPPLTRNRKSDGDTVERPASTSLLQQSRSSDHAKAESVSSPRTDVTSGTELTEGDDPDTDPEFSTPRSSAEMDQAANAIVSGEGRRRGSQGKVLTYHHELNGLAAIQKSNAQAAVVNGTGASDSFPLARSPEIRDQRGLDVASPASFYSQMGAVSPAYTTVSLPPEDKGVPPTSESAMQRRRGRNTGRHSFDGLVETDADRDALGSQGSASQSRSSLGQGETSSTSTYRIRRKPVSYSSHDEDQSSLKSNAKDDLDKSLHPAADVDVNTNGARPTAVDNDAEETPKAPVVQRFTGDRSPTGSSFMKKAQEAAKARMEAMRMEKLAAAGPAANKAPPRPVRVQRPSTMQDGPTTQTLAKEVAKQDTSEGATVDTTITASEKVAPAKKVASLAIDAGSERPTSRSQSRATLKRPSTAPVGSGGQFRPASRREDLSSVLEIEGLSFVLDQPGSPDPDMEFIQDEVKSRGTTRERTVPNAVVSLRSPTASENGHGSVSGHTIQTDRSESGHYSNARIKPSSVGWGIEQEMVIADKTKRVSRTGSVLTSADSRSSARIERKGRPDSGKQEKALSKTKSRDKPDGPPTGSYSIHPPSMLQLFEASQCVVYDEDGREVVFGDLFKERRTLVCFLRHWWCGFCQQFSMSVKHIDPLPLKKANMDLVLIGQGDWQIIKAYRQVMGVPYPIYADPNRHIYRALGMTLRTNDANPVCARPDYATLSMTKGILVAIKKGIFDMPIRNPGDMKLLGGDFILGPGLQCSFTHRMTTADGHMDIPRILAQAGCDLSLKSPKPKTTAGEMAARLATLAGGNRNGQTRSLGRKTKKKDQVEALPNWASMSMMSLVSSSGSMNSTSGKGMWGKFTGSLGRNNRSQVSLPGTVDYSMDSVSIRRFESQKGSRRSSSALRKVSEDSRYEDTYDSLVPGSSFDSRRPSADTRFSQSADSSQIHGSDAASAVHRDRYSRISAMSSTDDKGGARHTLIIEPPEARRFANDDLIDDVPRSPTSTIASEKEDWQDTVSSRRTPTEQRTPTSPQPAKSLRQSTSLSSFQNKIMVKQRKSSLGLGIHTSGDPEPSQERSSSRMSQASRRGLSTDETWDESGERQAILSGRSSRASEIRDRVSTEASPRHNYGWDRQGPDSESTGPGSFLMDLDVYDSLARQPVKKAAAQDDDVGARFPDETFGPADSDSDTERAESAGGTNKALPKLPGAQPIKESYSSSSSVNTSPSDSSIKTSPSGLSSSSRGSSSSFASPSLTSMYSYGTFRAKPILSVHQEEDEEEEEEFDNGDVNDEEEDEDEQVEFEEIADRDDVVRIGW